MLGPQFFKKTSLLSVCFGRVGEGTGRNFGFVLTRYGEPMNKLVEGRTMSS
jgi:hypothetical protein